MYPQFYTQNFISTVSKQYLQNKAKLKIIFVSPYPTPFYWYVSVGQKIIFLTSEKLDAY